MNADQNQTLTISRKVTPLRAIAIILAQGVLRLQQRQKRLDNLTEQSVHGNVLATKEKTL